MSALERSADEERARRRYQGLNAARVGGIAVTIAGLAGVREALPVDLPYPLSVVMVIGGVLSFFFGPWILVKRWKAQDRAEGREE
ncbi:MAG: hypothetical protein AAF291_08765 [Pseudomonadota bacterium]